MREQPKYPRYQDYVIKNGRLVGEFEQMYRDYEDPWEQTVREDWAAEKDVALHLLRWLKATEKAERVIELGCGLGRFTRKIAGLGLDVLGVDVSATAIRKAQAAHPSCRFLQGDLLDAGIYRTFRPDVIVMAEITWYVLDKLDAFLALYRRELPHAWLLHLLATYPPGVQKYGADKFTDLAGILSYFGLRYSHWGECHGPETGTRTYFLGRPGPASNKPDSTNQKDPP